MPSRPPLAPLPAPEGATTSEQKSPHAWALLKMGEDTPKGRKLSPRGAFAFAGAQHEQHWIEDDRITEARFDECIGQFMAQKIER